MFYSLISLLAKQILRFTNNPGYLVTVMQRRFSRFSGKPTFCCSLRSPVIYATNGQARTLSHCEILLVILRSTALPIFQAPVKYWIFCGKKGHNSLSLNNESNSCNICQSLDANFITWNTIRNIFGPTYGTIFEKNNISTFLSR